AVGEGCAAGACAPMSGGRSVFGYGPCGWVEPDCPAGVVAGEEPGCPAGRVGESWRGVCGPGAETLVSVGEAAGVGGAIGSVPPALDTWAGCGDSRARNASPLKARHES